MKTKGISLQFGAAPSIPSVGVRNTCYVEDKSIANAKQVRKRQIPLSCFGHLASKPLCKACTSSTSCALTVCVNVSAIRCEGKTAPLTSRAHTTSPFPSSSPPLLCLFTTFITLQSICSFFPGWCPTETDVKGLLILFHHRADLLCQNLRELLGPCEFDAMEYDDARRLVQGCREFLRPDHP